MSERLVLLPGWSYPAAMLRPLANALHGDALRVELAELPALENPQQWLDELDARLPADCWLGGWSLGGMLAAELAARAAIRRLLCWPAWTVWRCWICVRPCANGRARNCIFWVVGMRWCPARWPAPLASWRPTPASSCLPTPAMPCR